MNNLEWKSFAECISDYVGISPDEINEETDIFEDLCIDSLGLFGLGAHITDIYHLNVPLSSVSSICKVGEMFRLLNEEGTPAED